MGETTDQIESHIENKREDLQSNLQELENKVKSATDWRGYFQKYTGTMVAAAFGGGVLISALTARTSRAQASPTSETPLSAANRRSASKGTHEILETWDTIKTALVGVAATKFKGMLGEVVPGFSEHLAKAETKRTPQSARSAENIIEEGMPSGRSPESVIEK